MEILPILPIYNLSPIKAANKSQYKVRAKVGRLLGVLGRARSVLGGGAILSLYNGLVLPPLQYCLMVWGDFQGGRNVTLGGALLRYQKRFAGLVAGRRGQYHADPLFAQFSMLKVGDLYRQQLRVHAWRFRNGRLPDTGVREQSAQGRQNPI